MSEFDDFWQDDIDATICRNGDIMVKRFNDSVWHVISKESLYTLLTENIELFEKIRHNEFMIAKMKNNE
jgi:hypothetical protein